MINSIKQKEHEQRQKLQTIAISLVDSINNSLPKPKEVRCPLCSAPDAKQETIFSHVTTGLKPCYINRISCTGCDKKVTMPVK